MQNENLTTHAANDSAPWRPASTPFHPRSRQRRVLILLLAALAPLSSYPQELWPTESAKEPPKLNAHFTQTRVRGVGEITRGVIVAQTHQFSLILPKDFRSQVDAAGKTLRLTSADYGCSIVLAIHEALAPGKVDLKPDVLRSEVLSRHPESKLVDEFTASIESMKGPAFEVEWTSSSGPKMTTRTMFVPYPGGHIEITTQALSNAIRAYDAVLNQLLLSIRSAPIGSKLHVREFQRGL